MDADSDMESDLDYEWEKSNNNQANFANFARQLQYDRTDNRGTNQYYSPYYSGPREEPQNTIVDISNNLPDDAFNAYGNTQFRTQTTQTTSLFLIDSKNRDKLVFPQPTSFTLKPPRVYKNVISIQVVQIKLLSSFFYFSIAKGNTFLPVIENGRESINTFLGRPLTESITIPEGTYSITELLTSLQQSLNFTPVFYDFPSGISGFVSAFTANGDLGVNFNQPGDTYYDTLNNVYVQNPTMDIIVSYYWGSRYSDQSQYNINQIKVAYYFPVLYEVFLDINDTGVRSNLNLDIPASLLNTNETVYSRIVFNSRGINDNAILYLINANISLLDRYRDLHTFRYSLVNRYILSYNTNNLRVNIAAASLNTSLVNLINNANDANLAKTLNTMNISTAAYSNLITTINTYKVVFSDMYNFMQENLVQYFAVNFATYSAGYLANPNNTIFIQNGYTASNVRSNYTIDFLTSGANSIISSAATYYDSPGYWPRFIPANTASTLYGGGINSGGINEPTSLIPFNTETSNFNFNAIAIDNSNYFINTNRYSKAVTTVVNILPGQYSVFKFRSPVRQTLQVETLPIPYYQRFADYNLAGVYGNLVDKNLSNLPQAYFSTAYDFVYVSTNKLMDSSNYAANLLPVFTASTMTYSDAFLSTPLITLTTPVNYLQYQFTAPTPNSNAGGLYAYNTTISFLSISTSSQHVSTLFASPVSAFVYHDRAAFMADIGTPFKRKENPLHYIASSSATPANSDLTINISTFSGNDYYLIFRSQSTTFQNVQFKPVVYADSNYVSIKTDYVNFSPTADPYANSNIQNLPFLENYNTDYIRLPSISSLQGTDPSDPKYNIIIDVKQPLLGYDISGVSNDLTDYRGYTDGMAGFIPDSIFRIDPLTNYTFQSIEPFNSVLGTYLVPGSDNSVLESLTNNEYVYKGTLSSQINIVHWYDDHFIPRQQDDYFTTFSTIGFSQYPSSIQTSVYGYPYDANSNIQFGRGINAIGFLPTDGLYNVNSFTFKSAIYPLESISTTTEDPNTLITQIGVFTGNALATRYITLSTALTVLSFNKSVTYGPATESATPGFGIERGTWYEYLYDPSYVAESNVSINGYSQGSNEMLGYNSMYYMVPFYADGTLATYSYLTGSVLPYPLSQTVSTGTTYFGQSAASIYGFAPQPMYIMPSTIVGANSNYGPQNGNSYTQSQYEQSQPITTTSIGYKELGRLVNNSNTIYPFATTFSNALGRISTVNIGLTTFVSEYSNSLYIVNSMSSFNTISNAQYTFQAVSYTSSISTSIGKYGGTVSCMQYLLTPPSTLQNYSYVGLSNYTSTLLFEDQGSSQIYSNVTTRSISLDSYADIATVWLWGGGGATWTGGIAANSNQMGGAGAYAKADINIKSLNRDFGISTLYFVVGKGGNKDNFTFNEGYRINQQNGQARYGGGGTSVIELSNGTAVKDNIGIQGGGFSGIFIGSNLETATPLIVVGGGGGGGAYTIGGPGMFRIDPSPLPIQVYPISDAALNTLLYKDIPISAIFDWDTLTVNTYKQPAIGLVNSIINTSLAAAYLPSYPPFHANQLYSGLNGPIGNFNLDTSAAIVRNVGYDVYRFNLKFNSNVSTISKLRYFGGPYGEAMTTKPTGFTIYGSIDKSEMLYSNTEFTYSGSDDIILLNNGIFGSTPQQAIDLFINIERSSATNVTSGWVTCGLGTSSSNSLQYSLDGLNWAPIRTQSGPGTPLRLVKSVTYLPSGTGGSGGGLWYACGNNTIMRSSNGLDWSSSGIANPYIGGSLNTIAYNNNVIVIGGDIGTGPGTIMYSSDSTNWAIVPSGPTGSFSSSVSKIRYIGSNFFAINPNEILSIRTSVNSIVWTSIPITSGIVGGAYDITFDGVGTYIVAMGIGGLPLNTQIVYGTGTATTPPTVFSPVSPINLVNFTCTTVTYGKGIFVAAGFTTDGSSPTKYSKDGINWLNSDVIPVTDSAKWAAQTLGVPLNQYHVAGTTVFNPSMTMTMEYEMVIYDINYNSNSGTFISMGRGSQIIDATNSQLSILTSGNGSNWSLTQSGGFNNMNMGSMRSLAYSGGYGDLSIIPDLTSIYVEMWRINDGNRLSINGIKAFGDSGQIPALSNNPLNSISSICDQSLSTFWQPDDIQTSEITNYNITMSLSTPVNLINKFQLFVPANSNRYFTGLKITDSSSDTLFNQQSIVDSNYRFDTKSGLFYYEALFDPPLVNMSTLTMDISKLTPAAPRLYEIRAVYDPNEGFIQQGIRPLVSDADGNDAFGNLGGYGGANLYTGSNSLVSTLFVPTGLNGSYLLGGTPASAGEYFGMTNFSTIIYGAGGGGGGYYGGGGGGIVSYDYSGKTVYEGGAGGGGYGYISPSTTLIILRDYAMADASANYLPPALSQQEYLVNNTTLPNLPNPLGYGAGGVQSNMSGQGEHGAIVINLYKLEMVSSFGNAVAEPNFIDGSRLSLFESPIKYIGNGRSLPFTAYSDAIQSTKYGGYNWVWLRAYLSLTGTTLNPSTMTANSSAASPPTSEFPSLPSIVYFAIEEQFSNVIQYFSGTRSIAQTITDGMEIGFELFNQYFIETVYTDPTYKEMTELYCLLDYLRKPENLVNPHIDGIHSPISRVFGGIPRFGYWANPFFTNVSYIGFDIGISLSPTNELYSITGNSNQVQAFYGLVMEQSLTTGVYTVRDIMAYKPTVNDAINGSNWLIATQFPESYIIRNISTNYNNNTLTAQPQNLKSAIEGKIPLFNYRVYNAPVTVAGTSYIAPIHSINDFQGQNSFIYSFQNDNLADVSTLHLTKIPITSTIFHINEINLTPYPNTTNMIFGTAVTEQASTILQVIDSFGFDLRAQLDPYAPAIRYTTGSNNYYNSYLPNSKISSINVGKAIIDYNGELYVADNKGDNRLYENICTSKIYQQPFYQSSIQYASPGYILNKYNTGVRNPYYDFFLSRQQNLWHIQGTSNLSTIYGARLNSDYDFSVTTNFANHIFYPTHKIGLSIKGSFANPMQYTPDLTTYPSYPHTQMFFYDNYSTMSADISGKFALEKASNFKSSDTEFSGYFFNSFINNINLQSSSDYNNSNPDSFNYLAIRAYSPSETFKTLVRFHLPGRYDFGYAALADLSNEIQTLQILTNYNPDYLYLLGQFTSSFAITRTFGANGIPGFGGVTITSASFGDFLGQYTKISNIINSNYTIQSTVTAEVQAQQSKLISGDLRNILPAGSAIKERASAPLEFSLPFSTFVQSSNISSEMYGLGYNLGFDFADTPFNTLQQGNSFFKILDDYIYLKLNDEYNMNTLDISRQENYAVSHDAQAESKLYNCKLILNSFGTYSTTFVQNPVTFNPPIGKLDKLTFSWYDANGNLLNNAECEWTGTIQIIESENIATLTSLINNGNNNNISNTASSKEVIKFTGGGFNTGSTINFQ